MPTERYVSIDDCRICGSSSVSEFLDLGMVPAVNNFQDAPDASIEKYPLKVVFCEECNHVQLENTVQREALFQHYTYFSSASDPLLNHFGQYAAEVEQDFLTAGDLVVELGCNDGVLLSQFSDEIQTLGVEPAENVAKTARERHGLDIITELFDADVAMEARERHGEAQALVANNVVGHIDDLHELMHGVDALLDDDGVFVMEVPYLIDLINNAEFDTIYHEHISYFAVRPLSRLLQQHGFTLFNIERLSIHGGSIRAYIQRQDGSRQQRQIVSNLRTLERALGLDELATFERFASDVSRYRSQLRELLKDIEGDASVVGYGAPAKGNVLLNYCDIDANTLDYIVDTTPAKQGTYTPGTDIPVRPPSDFHDDSPEYALLLAWNYKDEILEKEREYRKQDGQFILPQPYVDLV